jgi:hypothetical protein
VTPLKIGSRLVTSAKIGSRDLTRVMLGARQVWPDSAPASVEYGIDTLGSLQALSSTVTYGMYYRMREQRSCIGARVMASGTAPTDLLISLYDGDDGTLLASAYVTAATDAWVEASWAPVTLAREGLYCVAVNREGDGWEIYRAADDNNTGFVWNDSVTFWDGARLASAEGMPDPTERHGGIADLILDGESSPVWVDDAWMLPRVPAGAQNTIAQSGWAFRLGQAAIVNTARVYSSSAASRNRRLRIWRASDEASIASVDVTTPASVGWHEATFASAVNLAADTEYIVTHARVGSTANTAAHYTAAQRAQRRDSLVRFYVEYLGQRAGAHDVFPDDDTIDFMTAVDLFLERPTS